VTTATTAYSSPFQPLQEQEDEGPDRFQPETPFLNTRFSSEAWSTGEQAEASSQTELQYTPRVETPFLTEYLGEAPVNSEAVALEQTLQELFNRDFNEAVSNLAMEAAAQAEQYSFTSGETGAQQMLTEWLDPLRRATEALFETVGEAATQQQLEAMGETELEAFFQAHSPPPNNLAPEFEEFFGKAFDKIKSVVRTGVNLAKKGIGALGKLVPIGIILKKLGGLVRPLLNRVIKFALNKLPASLRPAADLLGRRLGIIREFETQETGEAPTTQEAESIPQEFDAAVASLLLARDETEGQAFLAEAAAETPQETDVSAIGEADAARERFVAQFSQLAAGENAGPVVQQFIPAILPVLRIALTVVGRQRVVNFLAGYVAKLIQPYVGPQAATALSRALVDVGLRLITLEAEEESPSQTAARSVVATLEDTIQRVAEYGFEHFDRLDESLEQQHLLEAITNEAFFEATIAHFPSQLLDAQRLEDREMMFETGSPPGVWAYRPRPRYKKYTRIYDVTITPQIASQVRSFGATRLDAFLRSQNVRLPIRARVHLFQAIPGTTLSRIALLEKRTPGLGSGAQSAWSKIHPLTEQASGLLLSEPRLGKTVEARFLESRNMIAVGQRFYYLELPHSGGGVITAPKGARPSEVNLTIDLRTSQIRIAAFLSEPDAQKIVAAGPVVGSQVALVLISGLAAGAVNSVRTGVSRHVTILREANGELQGEDFWQAIASEVGKKILVWFLAELAKALLTLLKAALIRYLNTRLAEFTAAARNPSYGVTLVFTYGHPGLRVWHAILAGRLPDWGDARAAAKALQFPTINVYPGFRRP
jgi:hypothetical protein